MGRGRAKAKQQKVARDLKYNTPNTDLTKLQQELGGSAENAHPPTKWDDEADDDYEDDGRWAPAR